MHLATVESEWTRPEFPLRFATDIQSPAGLAAGFRIWLLRRPHALSPGKNHLRPRRRGDGVLFPPADRSSATGSSGPAGRKTGSTVSAAGSPPPAARVLLQRCTLKGERPFTGLMHVFIFYGALTFDTLTVNHTLEGFDSPVSPCSATGGLGPGLFLPRRPHGRPGPDRRRLFHHPPLHSPAQAAYRTTSLDSAVIYTALILVTLSYLYFEAFALAHQAGPSNVSLYRQPAGRSHPRVRSRRGGRRRPPSFRLVAPHSARLRLHRLCPPFQVSPHVRRLVRHARPANPGQAA